VTETVSVVIANYNMARSVGQAIRSVLGQSRPPIEVIVVDDGSTDNSRQVIREIAAEAPRVVVIEQPNSGQTRAKNAGARRATGSILGFCDADDYWLPQKLEMQLPLFERSEVALVYSGARWVDLEDRTLGRVPQRHFTGRVLGHLIVENFVPFGTALVRRSAFEAVGRFDERYRMGIDWAAWLRLARTHEFEYLDAVTYIYRVWEGQMSTDKKGRFDAALRIMRDFIAEHRSEIPASAIRCGYADTYANRALWNARTGAGVSAVASDVLRAIAASPLSRHGWMAAVKCVLGRT
jgi:glycosyltransferase involved in cell wall biosynthesis